MRKKIFFGIICLLLSSCSAIKYVPEDELLLTHTQINVEKGNVSQKELKNYLRQQPNNRLLGVFGINLGLYNLSGKDTSKWVNRTLRKIGEAPVLYDELLAARSGKAMERYLFSKGYFESNVQVSTNVFRKQRVKSIYQIHQGQPYQIKSYQYRSDSLDLLDSLLMSSITHSPIRPGQLFDSEALNKERDRLALLARNKGYYAINRDHFGYKVDSALNTHQVEIELQVKPYTRVVTDDDVRYEKHLPYRINKVYFLLDVSNTSYNRSSERFSLADYDTIQVEENMYVIYRDEPFLRPQTLLNNCFIMPQALFNVDALNKTYMRLNALKNLKSVNIRFINPQPQDNDLRLLDCYIVMDPGKDNLFSIDVEGTNTAGDLGIAGTLTYSHQNFFKGGELYSARLRGAYEALSSSFSNDYLEYGGEMNLLLPDFRMPFLTRNFRKRIDATTNFQIRYDNLSRPEFLRTTAGSSVEYSWHSQQIRHTFNPIDFAYVYMPRVDSSFRATYLTDDSYLKYSYEDQFILRMAYGFLYSSLPLGVGVTNRTYYTWRVNLESAGNIMGLMYGKFGTKNSDGQYTIAGTPYSQYLKGEFEYTRNIVLNSRNRVAYRAGIGVAYPYGNSKILPFEKRFYSGGANSVRGWSVRTLGPGTYKTALRTIDFMNQSGDMKIDLNLEFRQKWFWVLEGAFFVDAGNIWTIRSYDNQPGGQFKWDSFYKQLAYSLGMGLRFDFNFLLARVDVGMKTYDPSGLTANDRWRIKHIDHWDDFALHIAIGYPF